MDERGFEAIRRLRRKDATLSLDEFKAMVRQQFLMLVIDEEAAMRPCPACCHRTGRTARSAGDVRGVLAAAGQLEGESARGWSV